jgi:hypothetical protein
MESDLLADEKGRLIAIRKLYDGDNAKSFADRSGFNYNRWNNFERGYPFPRDAAFQLRRFMPAISIDWIWFGDEGGMPPRLLEELKKAALTGKPPRKKK